VASPSPSSCNSRPTTVQSSSTSSRTVRTTPDNYSVPPYPRTPVPNPQSESTCSSIRFCTVPYCSVCAFCTCVRIRFCVCILFCSVCAFCSVLYAFCSVCACTESLESPLGQITSPSLPVPSRPVSSRLVPSRPVAAWSTVASLCTPYVVSPHGGWSNVTYCTVTVLSAILSGISVLPVLYRTVQNCTHCARCRLSRDHSHIRIISISSPVRFPSCEAARTQLILVTHPAQGTVQVTPVSNSNPGCGERAG
jgi:hypothetical protein